MSSGDDAGAWVILDDLFGLLNRQVTIDLLLVADDSSARRDEHVVQMWDRVAAAGW
jgi:hypothetical protein